MRNLPDSVPIKGIAYGVRLVTQRTLRRISKMKCPLDEWTDTDRRIIYVDRACDEREKWSALLHGMMHAAFGEAHKADPIALDLKELEESVILLLESALFPALRATGWGPQE